jgi:hypothetical protein
MSDPATITDPSIVSRTTHPDSPERWAAAYQRALDAGLMIRPGIFGGPWTVTSKSRPDLCYAVDAIRCGCMAAEKGDPVCMHRAIFRAVTGTLPHAPAPANVTCIHRRRTAATGEPLSVA